MLRIKEFLDVVNQIIVGGEQLSRTEKIFSCTSCKREIYFYTVSQLRCPTCKAALPDVTRMMAGENGARERMYFHLEKDKIVYD